MTDPDLMPTPEYAGEPDRASALRMLRSLEASKARIERGAKLEADEARGKLILELLPVLDNLDRTIRAAHGSTGETALLAGVRMVRAQVEGVLLRFGVERVDASGSRFDPARHEAIGVVAVLDPALHGVVVDQAEAGYQLEGRLLRPAKVTVGRFGG